ncbi:nuclear GTPase SLIP-GC-like isoform X1 [Chiloscyllium plagiosum]|uniref:nuclear GTPase SLIP-GC-like isoform X1 n=1 Tax=Chiloscyllium plagiosum TaxID=36176 RepID=UPI001CB7EB31|nr:nuclear GTPase SLIP-GC-like isoform X1 [Chiloscyllium plagiosum]
MELEDSEGANSTSSDLVCTMELEDSEGANSTSSGVRRNLSPETPTGRKQRKRKLKGPHITAEDSELWKNCDKWEAKTKEIVEAVLKKLEETNSNNPNEENLLLNLKKKVQQLKEKCLRENIYVGVFGQTGAGKSTLLNAVFKEKSLLPTSSSGACTSAIIKVQSYEGRKFKAEIEFLSEQDWNNELKLLVELCGKEDSDDEVDDEDDKEVEMAKNKLQTVYGSSGPEKSYEELIKMNIYQHIPKSGKKLLREDNAEELSRKLDPYIRSQPCQTSKIYWPIVKSISVYIPNCQILPEGVVLIDFPGSGDTNKTRDEMWKKNLMNCSSVWIVSAIFRAVNEKIVHEIFGTSIKSATNGGRCHDVAFICTKTDDIEEQEYAREYRLTNEEMNLTDDDLLEYDRKRKQYCIRHRNIHVKKTMKKQYEEKWTKLMTKESTQLEFSKDDLCVYTVSAKQYWKLEHEHKGPSNNFAETTEISSLRKHIIDLYLKERKKVVNIYVSEVWGMLLLLISLNQNKQNEILKSRFNTINKEFHMSLEAFNEHLEDICKRLQDHLKQGVQEAEKKCGKVIQQQIERPGGRNYQGFHKTLKAICRNDGVFNSATFGPIDINHDLSKPLHQKIDHFCESTLQFNKGRRNSMKGRFNSIKLSLTNIIDEPLPTKSTAENSWVWKCRKDFMKTEINGLFYDLTKQITERKQHFYNAPNLSVQCSMKPAYKEAAQKKGAGVLPFMKKILKDHVEQKHEEFFKDARDSAMEQFNDMKEKLKKEIHGRMTITLELGFSQWSGHNPLPDFRNEFDQINLIWDEVKDLSDTD